MFPPNRRGKRFIICLLLPPALLLLAKDTLLSSALSTSAARKQTDSQEEQVSDALASLGGVEVGSVDATANATNQSSVTAFDGNSTTHSTNILDEIEDSFFDSLSRDPDCDDEDCWSPPKSTTETPSADATCSPESSDAQKLLDSVTADSNIDDQCGEPLFDKHWGSDPSILRMRDKLREMGSGASLKHHEKTKGERPTKLKKGRRPAVFLMPGLAATRLIAWKFKSCPQHPLMSDIKVQDNVWLNMNLVIQMGTLEESCMTDCLSLGLNQTDTDDLETGCKLRPDEGLDAISSLSPGGIGSQLIGGTNTVYAWLIQWLADNLGYDVSNIIGLPYDWRLSPDRMEERDGFLTLTRKRIEAAVKTNGAPGIVVAHSMGNVVFRYFLAWLRQDMREESYRQYLKRAQRRAKALTLQQQNTGTVQTDGNKTSTSYLPGWMSSVVSGFDEFWSAYFASHNGSLSEDSFRSDEADRSHPRHPQLWALAEIEGDGNWISWLEDHIWTYVGLSAPMLGAINPLRAVISGENMGLPLSDEMARTMELTFGSTHTVNPISSKSGFCDQHDTAQWDEEPSTSDKSPAYTKLACLDDIYTDIESGKHTIDQWENYPALKALMKDRMDWDSDLPMIEVSVEQCKENPKLPCVHNSTFKFSPRDSETGDLFVGLGTIWKEKHDPLFIKREQLDESFWSTNVPNILNQTWERPLIKHIIMAYGVDIPTEVGYKYKKKVRPEPDDFDGIPSLHEIIYEDRGELLAERRDNVRNVLTELLVKKKKKRELLKNSTLRHSGDGSVPYLSLAWAHTWLLHSERALKHSTEEYLGNPLSSIDVSHRPKGATEWVQGPPPVHFEAADDKPKKDESDTGTSHPHGTKYKPEMVRFHNAGKSRTTGIDYSTTVIEAIGVEHKETTRNYDILAAVFTDVLKHMHDDFAIF